MEFTTSSSKDPPEICGYNNGQHLYMDASKGLPDSNPVMKMTFTGK